MHTPVPMLRERRVSPARVTVRVAGSTRMSPITIGAVSRLGSRLPAESRIRRRIASTRAISSSSPNGLVT